MGVIGYEIFSDDLAADVRRDYNALLSIGKTDNEGERLTIGHYLYVLGNHHPDEAVFWFSLALSEWEKGRLSLLTKEKALYYIDGGSDLARWKDPDEREKRKAVLNDLKSKLLSEQPAYKKIKKASTKHCPWSEGALLAYKATNCTPDEPLHNKYLLLRIIRIVRSPISIICPDDLFNERMIVAVYMWAGAEVPDPSIVRGLDFAPTSISSPIRIENQDVYSEIESMPEEICQSMRKLLLEDNVRYCCDLPYHSDKYEIIDVEYLAEDEQFDRDKYPFLKTDLCNVSICGARAFELHQGVIFRKLGVV